MTPPIPVCLAHRPVVGGLAAPYITVEHREGSAALGAVHGTRVDRCLVKGLCQACGQLLGARLVVIVRAIDLEHGYSAEPALHPQCAAYSAKACPVLAGTMTRYRTTPRNLAGRPCGEPGCDCAGWVSEDGEDRPGAEVEPYYALWMSRADYRTAVDGQGRALGVALQGVTPLKVRPVNPQAVQAVQVAEATRMAMDLLAPP